MKRVLTLIFLAFSLTLGAQELTVSEVDALETLPSADQVMDALNRVSNWQMDHPGGHSDKNWTKGALFAGMFEWAKIADPEVESWMLRKMRRNRWKLGTGLSRFHADDHAVGWTYLEFYRKYGDKRMIKDLVELFDWILENRSQADLKVSGLSWQRWCWCDALFMSPPVWVNLYDLTGDERYLEFANSEWWATTDYLYDAEEHLYYRDSRHFKMREENGEKVFWGRGNGWVFAALPRMLQYLPENHPDMDRYQTLYREMAAKLVELQGDDGFWRASLLDPENYPAPETSATAFFAYGMLAGVRLGVLDGTYLVPAVKAWNAMGTAIHEDGKLGWIQPVGEKPKNVTRNMTEVYGVGGFMLAGTELYHMINKELIQ